MPSKKDAGRNFLDQLKFLNQTNKDYRISVGKLLKIAVTLPDVDTFLDTKRLEYNHAVVTLVSQFERHGLIVENLYDDLDLIWTNLECKTIFSQKKAKLGVIGGIALRHPIISPLVWGPVSADIAITVCNKWDKYKEEVFKQAEEYVQEMVESGE